MSVGFNSLNLAAAIELVMQLAAKKQQRRTFQVERENRKIFDLADAVQVRDFLMSKAEAAYERAGGSVVGQVLDMPYDCVGIVCEVNDAVEQVPPVICRSGERPAHLVYFWKVL